MARYVDLDEMVDVKIYDESCKDWVWNRQTIESVLSMCSGYSVYGSEEVEKDFSGWTGYREPKKVELKFYGNSSERLMCQVRGSIDNQIVKTFDGEWSRPKDSERKVLSIPYHFFRMFKDQMEQLDIMVPDDLDAVYEQYLESVQSDFENAAHLKIKLYEFFVDSANKMNVYYLNVNNYIINRYLLKLKKIVAYVDWDVCKDEATIVVPDKFSKYFIEELSVYGVEFTLPKKKVDISKSNMLSWEWRDWWKDTKPKLKAFIDHQEEECSFLSVEYVGHRERNLLCRIKGTLEDESRKIFKGRWIKAEDFSGYYLSIPLEQFPAFQSEMELKNVVVPKEMSYEYDRFMNDYADRVSRENKLKSVQQLMGDLVNSSGIRSDQLNRNNFKTNN